jgi:hypothetical protein
MEQSYEKEVEKWVDNKISDYNFFNQYDFFIDNIHNIITTEEQYLKSPGETTLDVMKSQVNCWKVLLEKLETINDKPIGDISVLVY